jgi:hypothetical protein
MWKGTLSLIKRTYNYNNNKVQEAKIAFAVNVEFEKNTKSELLPEATPDRVNQSKISAWIPE